MSLTTNTVGFRPAPLIEKRIAVNPNTTSKVRLIHEALSRARMRRPQAVTPSSEAHRPARQIAMQARIRAGREQGLY